MNEHLIKITCSQQCNFAVNVFDSPKIPHLRIWEFAQGAPQSRLSQTETFIEKKDNLHCQNHIVQYFDVLFTNQTRSKKFASFSNFLLNKTLFNSLVSTAATFSKQYFRQLCHPGSPILLPTLCRTQQFAFIPPVVHIVRFYESYRLRPVCHLEGGSLNKYPVIRSPGRYPVVPTSTPLAARR